MKKLSILTTVAALGVASSFSFTSHAANQNIIKSDYSTKGCVVIDCGNTDPSDIEATIDKIWEEIKCNGLTGCKVITIPITCNPGTNNNNPEIDTDIPETDNDTTESDNNIPEVDINQPDLDNDTTETDTNRPEVDTNIPEIDDDSTESDNNIPEVDINQPDTDNDNAGNDTNRPEVDTDIPETDNDTTESDNNIPGTEDDKTESERLSFAEQVVVLVNAERAKAGLNPVTLDKDIAAAALIRAKETEISFSHTRPNGSSFSTVLAENGIQYRGAGENIAWGQLSPEAVMNAWMNSSGHRANILNPKFTKIGVGYYQNAAGRNYWTQLFVY